MTSSREIQFARQRNRVLIQQKRGFMLVVLSISNFLVIHAWAADACVVQEHRFQDALTAHFSIGHFAADVTIPAGLLTDELLSVYVRTRSGDEEVDPGNDLLVGAGGETAPFRNGSLLHVLPLAGKRLSPFIVTRNGKFLCSWQPMLNVSRTKSSVIETDSRLRAVEQSRFRKIGEPVTILGTTLDEGDVFSIEGTAMTVLSITSNQVVLQDPEPRLGLRTIRCRDYETTLRFIAVDLRFLRKRSETKLIVRVTGLMNLNRDVHLQLMNHDRSTARLQCWNSARDVSGKARDLPEVRFLRFSPRDVHDGGVERACTVEILQMGNRPNIEALLLELPPSGHRYPLPTFVRR